MTWAFGNGIAILAVGIACLVMHALYPTECGIGPQNVTLSDGTTFTQVPDTNQYIVKYPDGQTGQGGYSGPGYPPLPKALFGTGIAYTIIGGVSVLMGVLMWFHITVALGVIVLWCSGGFLFAWMIVLSVSLWRDGYDCMPINFKLWQMGMAATIISIVGVCTTWYGAQSDGRNYSNN